MVIGENLDEVRAAIYAALDRHDYGAARRAIEKLRPSHEVEALGLLVSTAVESGDAAGAEDALAALEEAAPMDVYTRFLAARVQFMRGETVKPRQGLMDLLGQGNIPVCYQEKIYNLLGQCCRVLGRHEESTAAYLAAAKAAPEPLLAALEYSDYLFNSHYLPPAAPDERRQAAQLYGGFFCNAAPFLHRWRAAGKKLRIGYISPDLRRHVVLRFCQVLLTGYDRERFTVFAYLNGREDEDSRALAHRVDGWRNVFGCSPEETARQIYEDAIDILVDLAGHTRGNSLPALAFRPAPVQVSGIGYFASTGLSTMDYFLGDIHLDGAAEDGAFTEKLLRLPHSHFCYAPHGGEPAPAEMPPCVRNGYITFGSFNNFSKVTDAVLEVWGEILHRVPSSRLLLKAAVFGAADSRACALARIERAGIAPERLLVRPLTSEYLAEYGDMDIALDTFPYPGGGTTCDALYMGVPVVTLAGEDHGGRFGVSILENLGMGELIAASAAEYIDKAAALARDKGLLQALRQNLRPIMMRSPLMDKVSYMEAIEASYAAIWQRFCAGQTAPDYAARRRLAAQSDGFMAAGDTTQALAAADHILAARPADRALVEKLAVRYLDAGDGEGAAAAVDLLGLEEKPYGFGIFLAACTAALTHQSEKARQLAAEALERRDLLRWQRGAVYHLLAQLDKEAGDRRAAAEFYRQSSVHKEIEEGKLADYSNYLLNLHFDDRPAAEMAAAARGYGALLEGTVPYERRARRKGDGKLRIGYLSPDFCRHVVAGFAYTLFHDHDRDSFIVYGYANCAEDAVSRRLREGADGWRNIWGMAPEAVAQRVDSDGIDILVELAGHTGNNLLPVLAFRPAPVQICGIGYFATTGLSAVDYFLTDETAAPPGEDAFFTERLLRLPHSHLCYTPLDEAARPVAASPYRRVGYVTFGSLNQFDKVTDEMLQAWGEILRLTPGARLLLKAAAFDDAVRRAAVKDRLIRLGLPLGSIDMEGYTADYFAAYDRIDIALDTYPYPGGGTTCDALYCGVPVISRYGDNHHQRFGLSLLKNIGLDVLAAATWEEYVSRAAGLARDEELLTVLRQRLRGMMLASPVMAGRAYMRELEKLYREIWEAAP